MALGGMLVGMVSAIFFGFKHVYHSSPCGDLPQPDCLCSQILGNPTVDCHQFVHQVIVYFFDIHSFNMKIVDNSSNFSFCPFYRLSLPCTVIIISSAYTNTADKSDVVV